MSLYKQKLICYKLWHLENGSVRHSVVSIMSDAYKEPTLISTSHFKICYQPRCVEPNSIKDCMEDGFESQKVIKIIMPVDISMHKHKKQYIGFEA